MTSVITQGRPGLVPRNEIENGGIVSLHDGIPPANYTGHPSRVPTLLATSRLLTLLSQEGYEFVTVSDLVRQGQTLGD